MRDPSFYVSGLLDLANLTGAGEQRATWRQSMAALARSIADDGPGPLDALHPEALVRGVRVAIQSGLVDDLDWLDTAAAGAALYELASALPLGAEQRDLGRRVMSRMLSGDATAFVAIATRMAVGAAKGLGSPAVRARIALVTELPLGLGVADGPLALALCSRRDLAREWIGLPSTGSLPARRLAARLIERAAREAARRASQGDDHALRVFRSDTVGPAWERLLADRESLVWRHVAVARGLLAPWVPAYQKAIADVMSTSVTPTEWRRAAASLAAQVAVQPEESMTLASQALAGGLLDRDPGCAVAFAWGAPRAAEAEPEAAGELLDWMMDRAPAAVAEAIVELRAELGAMPFVERASARALNALNPASSRRDVAARDDGADALELEIARDLERTPRDDQPLRDQLARGLLAFAQNGAREAYAAARELLDVATGAVDALDAVAPEDDMADGRPGSLARRTSLGVLRDLDVSLLERDVLANLLHLGTGADALRAHDDALDALRDRLATWILARESKPLAESGAPSHPTMGLRRLRALLHLVDGDLGDTHEDPSRSTRLRHRWLVVANALLRRFEHDPPSILRRTVSASLARALDALVRAGACDVSDVLLVVARQVEDHREFETLAQASMDPDLIHVLARWAKFAEVCTPPRLVLEASRGSLAPSASGRSESSSMPPRSDLPSVMPPSALQPVPEHVKRLAAFDEMARELAPEGSGRSEALRTVLVRIFNALSGIVAARSLRGLATTLGGNEPEIATSLETALVALAQLTAGARGRLNPEREEGMPLVPASRPLTVAVARVLSGAEPQLRDHVVSACLDELLAGVPRLVSRLVSQVVWTLVELPVDRPSMESAPIKIADTLPQWLPARRTIGGFYVLRALSSGAVGSVFVVTRVEDRHDPQAERFALKVPEFSATAARSVSESEFLKMFRDEASALLSVPSHPNLARFVTFDVGARPKPILVMELVEGMTLERIIESGALDSKRAFGLLDDILAGLEAMHGAGVGHLDIKPSNVVLRKQGEGVLVDFGLAGRHIRPGCATGSYGAPEVWGAVPDGVVPTPMGADVYAFGCVAYEVLTGRTLFDGDNEMTQISQHISHDGFPPHLRESAAQPTFAAVAEIIFSTLRRDPRSRPTASALRAEMQRVSKQIGKAKWPLA